MYTSQSSLTGTGICLNKKKKCKVHLYNRLTCYMAKAIRNPHYKSAEVKNNNN